MTNVLPEASRKDLRTQKIMRAIRLRNMVLPPSRLEKWKAKPRELYTGMPPKKVLDRVQVELTTVEGWTVYRVTARSAATPPSEAILYLHGGGYVLDFPPNPYWNAMANLAEQTGRTVIVPIYPLAPEHSYREVYPTLVALYEHLVAEFSAANLALAGDSAGGGMALALADRLREGGIPQPSSIVLISPWLDVTMKNPEVAAVAGTDALLVPEHLVNAAEAWAAGDSLDLPIISPIHVSLAGLARVTIFTGTHDILWPDARKYHEQALADGIDHGWFEKKNAMHVWILSAPVDTPDWRALTSAFSHEASAVTP